VNLSEKTRKELVLDVLRAAEGGWVNTTEIANAQVGGSEGMRRLRELRADGYTIERRGHPDPKVSQYQYRLVDEPMRPKNLGLRGKSFDSIVLDEARTIEPPYINWKWTGHSAKATHGEYDLFIHQNWTGQWLWTIQAQRPGTFQEQGQSPTRAHAMHDAAVAVASR
jgi:hypothetical protein